MEGFVEPIARDFELFYPLDAVVEYDCGLPPAFRDFDSFGVVRVLLDRFVAEKTVPAIDESSGASHVEGVLAAERDLCGHLFAVQLGLYDAGNAHAHVCLSPRHKSAGCVRPA